MDPRSIITRASGSWSRDEVALEYGNATTHILGLARRTLAAKSSSSVRTTMVCLAMNGAPP